MVFSPLLGKHKPYLTIHLRDYAMPGWPSWLGRKTHRVLAKNALVLRHLEVAGSNPAPGTYFARLYQSLRIIDFVNSLFPLYLRANNGNA